MYYYVQLINADLLLLSSLFVLLLQIKLFNIFDQLYL